jgi:hypothetical protein
VTEFATLIGDDLHGVLREAAAAGPIAVDDTTGVVGVLHHADIQTLARDPRLAGVGLSLFDLMGIGDGPLRDWYGRLMFTNEGAEHQRLRSLVARAFTPRAVERLRTDARTIADEALAPLASARRGDLTASLALVPMGVMCRLLGVPDDRVEAFGRWADDLSPIFGFMDAAQIERASAAVTALVADVDELVDERRNDPGDDLVTALLAAEEAGDRLTHDEVVIMVANLLVGGHDTTASQIGCSLLALLRHADELRRVDDQPSLVASAVAETIRFEPSITGVPRTALAPLEAGGAEIARGSIVLLMTAAANREPGVWDEPDRLDVDRFTDAGAPRLLTFGSGPHYCLGANLARMTLEETLASVVDLGPIEPTMPLDDVEWRLVLGRSPASLPVALSGS